MQSKIFVIIIMFLSITITCKADPQADFESNVEQAVKGDFNALGIIYKNKEGKAEKYTSEVSSIDFDKTEKARKALEALIIAGDSDAMKSIQLLQDNDNKKIRIWAKKLLSPKDIALISLLEKLKTTKNKLQAAIVLSLGNLKDERVICPIVSLANSEDEAVRMSVAKALGNYKNQLCLNTIEKLFKDEDPDVQASAVFALANFNSDHTKELLLEALVSPHGYVRVAAIIAIKNNPHKKAIPILIDYLENPTNGIQDKKFSVSHRDQGHTHTTEFDPIKHFEKMLPNEAGETLRAITNQDFKFDSYLDKPERIRAILKWRKWWGTNEKSFEFPVKKEAE